MGYTTTVFILLVGNCWVYSAAMDRKQQEIGNSREMQNELCSELQFVSSTALTYLQNDNSFRDPTETKALVSQARGRLPFMLPVMYNLGVITTLLVVLTFLMFKGLTLGVIILILNLNGKGWKQTNSRPVHIHVHGTKQPFYLPEWDRTEESNNTDEDLAQIFHPRNIYKHSS